MLQSTFFCVNSEFLIQVPFWQNDGLNITMATQILCKQITWLRQKGPQSISHREAGPLIEVQHKTLKQKTEAGSFPENGRECSQSGQTIYYIKNLEIGQYVQVDLKSFEKTLPFFPGNAAPVQNKKLWTGWSPHPCELAKISFSVNKSGT